MAGSEMDPCVAQCVLAESAHTLTHLVRGIKTYVQATCHIRNITEEDLCGERLGC